MSGRRFASPYAWRLAAERGMLLKHLAGSGPGGRIVARDVTRDGPDDAKPRGNALLHSGRFALRRQVVLPDIGADELRRRAAAIVARIGAEGVALGLCAPEAQGVDWVDPPMTDGSAGLGLGSLALRPVVQSDGHISAHQTVHVTLSVEETQMGPDMAARLLERIAEALAAA